MVNRALLCLWLLLPLAAMAERPADFVFEHGAVYTVENDQPWAEAVAVRADRIVYVGTEAGV
ncbi:MAG: amidohydrolase, partial [Gammaproteobacteria bacterium]|nr:amidohydrolase [Gammaproteobacteria bacterium]